MVELKSMRKFLILVLVFIIHSFLPGPSAAQTGDSIPADEIVGKAAEQTKVYVETFKNLLSEEKKTFEIFDKKGEVKKRKTVESTFLVYPLSKAEGEVAEFRSVTDVDGKKLERMDDRAKSFFETVAASENSQRELDRIRDESTRFDEDFAISGLTLFQAVALSDQLRGAFRFALLGTELLDGHKVHIIQFEQVRANSTVTINSRTPPTGGSSHNYDIEIDDEAVELNPRICGKLWIDADTFNIRRELRERTIQPGEYERPMVVAEDVLEYADSEFGILTPKKLIHLQYRVFLKDRQARKDTRVVFDYSKFTRPDVEVKSADVKDGN